jgi:hypothetical protein
MALTNAASSKKSSRPGEALGARHGLTPFLHVKILNPVLNASPESRKSVQKRARMAAGRTFRKTIRFAGTSGRIRAR